MGGFEAGEWSRWFPAHSSDFRAADPGWVSHREVSSPCECGVNA